MSGVLFRDHAEAIRNCFLGEHSRKNAYALLQGITVLSLTFPGAASDSQINDSGTIQSYFEAVKYQHAILTKNNTLTTPFEKNVVLVGGSSVLMKCDVVVRGR